jgi:hypothetical protein
MSAADRQRRRRERERNELDVYPVEVHRRLIEALIDLHWITEDEAQDKRLVASKLALALSYWANGQA